VAFYNTVVAQAQKIEFGADRVTFAFLPTHRILREQLEQNRTWLEPLASGIAGKRVTVGAVQVDASTPVPDTTAVAAASPSAKPADLRTAAMADSAVQAMLDVFPAEIENVEEIE
jgi:hypothetical protein